MITEKDISLDKGDLDRKIAVDGEIFTVGDVNAENFDIFVYQILYQMYDRKKRAENRYEMSFWEYDFKEPFYRILALNKLRNLNQEHAGPPKFRPPVPLFVEEPA